jgi:hypothetical protein
MECDGLRRVVTGNRIEIRIEVVGLLDSPAALLRWACHGGARPHPAPHPNYTHGPTPAGPVSPGGPRTAAQAEAQKIGRGAPQCDRGRHNHTPPHARCRGPAAGDNHEGIYPREGPHAPRR